MITTIVIIGAMGFSAGFFLSLASKKFHVEVDPREQQIIDALPSTNCGACGFPGCEAFASAIIKEEASTNGCIAGGSSVTDELSQIMGVASETIQKEIAVVLCKGGSKEAKNKYIYLGVKDCKSAAILAQGPKSCVHGCMGFGTCEKVCLFDALAMDENNLPVIDEGKCTGCRLCVVNCPKLIIKMIPAGQKVHIRCNSHDKGNVTRKVCTVGCIGCTKCVKVCEQKAITMDNNLAVIDATLCTNCEDCISHCPTNTIESYIERNRNSH